MKITAVLFACVAVSGCVAESAEGDFEFGQPVPMQPGKGDGPSACGTESCEAELCGYDCSAAGSYATRSCAASDGRADTYVAATLGGSASGSFDTRTNPYVPLYSTQNVLAYGCQLWDYTNGSPDGFQVQYEEIIQTSIVVDPNRPTRTGKDFGMYLSNFMGPGSYQATGFYRATSDDKRGPIDNACSVDVSVDAAGTVAGTFTCSMDGASAQGSFSCSKNSLNYPLFVKWAAAPQ